MFTDIQKSPQKIISDLVVIKKQTKKITSSTHFVKYLPSPLYSKTAQLPKMICVSVHFVTPFPWDFGIYLHGISFKPTLIALFSIKLPLNYKGYANRTLTRCSDPINQRSITQPRWVICDVWQLCKPTENFCL